MITMVVFISISFLSLLIVVYRRINLDRGERQPRKKSESDNHFEKTNYPDTFSFEIAEEFEIELKEDHSNQYF